MLYVILEYADEKDLEKYINQLRNSKIKISDDHALFIFVQLLSAVQELHEKKIIHRDIKPQNVFMSYPCSVKLGDFGVSKVMPN